MLTPLPTRGEISGLGAFERLRSDELRVEVRVTILEQHVDDLTGVRAEFIQGLALRMRSRPAGDVADEQVRFLIALDYSSKGARGSGPSP